MKAKSKSQAKRLAIQRAVGRCKYCDSLTDLPPIKKRNGELLLLCIACALEMADD